ncbi:MAG TPA: zf-HC2 domain-containing protein [Candidatus Eisenbacteria bacterium]|nr:zf-HC2 domain-containing protein [Candidatus Eisenbacteria bacterium]
MNVSQPHPQREELFAYRDGELKADRRVVIEAHVLGCHACRELIDEVSRMEAELGAGAPAPKEAYFERLTEKVMAKVLAADTAPAVERRRPGAEAEAEWEEKRRLKPKLPWFALASTASAGAAVIVVVVLLVREGAVLRHAPSVAVLERSAPDAARTGAKADSGAARGRGAREEVKKRANRTEPPAVALPSENLKAAADKEQVRADGKSEANKVNANEPQQEGVAVQGKISAAREKDLASRAGSTSDELALRKSSPQPSAAIAPPTSTAEPVGSALRSLLDRYGLPPVWGPGVSDEMVLKAEPALRNIYRTGGAATAADSARVRLYVAEAIRARAGASPDAAAIDEIVHHYRRAIRLAGNDAEVRRVAAERLADFLSELGDEPALHPPEGEGGQP